MLSSRWKLIWKAMPCLDFASYKFCPLPNFSKFVTNVLSHRNHQIDVTSVKLDFDGAASQAFVRKIAIYAFSHNVQELSVTSWPQKDHEFPPCLFSSQTQNTSPLAVPLNHQCLTPKTPWDFPALTTLHLSEITLCDDNCAHVEVFDIITPRLSNLMLIHVRELKAINLVSPQLESLTLIDCYVSYLNLPPRISSLCHKDCKLPKWFKDSCHSVNKVTESLFYHSGLRPYNEEDFRELLTCFKSSVVPNFSRLALTSLSNLISLNIDSGWGKVSYKVKMSTEATNLLEYSPNAIFVMDLPEEVDTDVPDGSSPVDQRAIDENEAADNELLMNYSYPHPLGLHGIHHTNIGNTEMCLKNPPEKATVLQTTSTSFDSALVAITSTNLGPSVSRNLITESPNMITESPLNKSMYFNEGRNCASGLAKYVLTDVVVQSRGEPDRNNTASRADDNRKKQDIQSG
nr:hypothetical protein [Tanacetum cinerariifolium]